MKIALLLPTRKRVHCLERTLPILDEVTSEDNEVVLRVWIDNDDQDTIDYFKEELSLNNIDVRYWIKDRIRYHGPMWNFLWETERADFYMLLNDDIKISEENNMNWDKAIVKEYNKFSDGIVLIHGDDQDPFEVSFPILSDEVTSTLGYFTWSGKFLYGDTWLNDIFKKIYERTGEIRVLHNEKIIPDDHFRIFDEVMEDIKSSIYKVNMKEKYYSLDEERTKGADKLIEVMEVNQ